MFFKRLLNACCIAIALTGCASTDTITKTIIRPLPAYTERAPERPVLENNIQWRLIDNSVVTSKSEFDSHLRDLSAMLKYVKSLESHLKGMDLYYNSPTERYDTNSDPRSSPTNR